jgi:hypothetical protein
LTAYETGFSGRVIAPYSRFYLGGETDLRGFDVRTVSPVVFVPSLTTTSIPYTNPFTPGIPGSVQVPTLSYQTSFPGGDTQGVANFEYRIPIAPHVSTSLFADFGATGAVRHDQLQLNSTDLNSLQTQFPPTPTFPGVSPTLPFQPGTNFKLRSTVGIELVVQLPIVQAPFRIYWGYNLNRMAQVITAPRTQFPGDPNLALTGLTIPNCDPKNGITTNCFDTGWSPYLPHVPEVWNSQVVPEIQSLFLNPQRTNFFDPIRTFRFTVSRTF